MKITESHEMYQYEKTSALKKNIFKTAWPQIPFNTAEVKVMWPILSNIYRSLISQHSIFFPSLTIKIHKQLYSVLCECGEQSISHILQCTSTCMEEELTLVRENAVKVA